MVQVMRPKPGEILNDPAVGTGGFLLAFYDYVEHNYQLDKDQKLFLKNKTLRGTDIVDRVARLSMSTH